MPPRYAITDSDEVAARAAAEGAAMIQLRAKELSGRALHELARRTLAGCAGVPVLINTRADVALVVGAAGVHLTAGAPAPREFRRIAPCGFLIGVSCHTIEDVRRAEDESADFAVFGPVFETHSHPGARPVGVDALRAACAAARMPVWALGGVTAANAQSCVEAGAAGVAGISMFRG